MNASISAKQKPSTKTTDFIVHGLSLLMAVPSVLMLANFIFSGAASGDQQLDTILKNSGESSERLLIASLLCTPLYIRPLAKVTI